MSQDIRPQWIPGVKLVLDTFVYVYNQQGVWMWVMGGKNYFIYSSSGLEVHIIG